MFTAMAAEEKMKNTQISQSNLNGGEMEELIQT